MNTAQLNEANTPNANDFAFRIDVLTPRFDGHTYEIEDSIDVWAQNVELAEQKMRDFVSSKAKTLYPQDYKSFTYELLETGIAYSAEDLEELDDCDYFGVMSISYDGKTVRE